MIKSDSPLSSSSRPILPSANAWRIRDFSSLLMPECMGPPGTNATGIGKT